MDVLDTFSVHPASPVLLTSKGPQKTQAIRSPLSLRAADSKGMENASR